MNFVKNDELSKFNQIRAEKTKSLLSSSPLRNYSNEDLAKHVTSLLDNLKVKDSQFSLNGKDNIWILKPAGLSRGRGISCISKFEDFLKFLKSNGNQLVAQKYIENPLIIHNRKFDIRVWVLVTSWNPLTIWIFDAPYIRFGAEDYNPQDLNNLYIHLTNNSIAKLSENFGKSVIEGNMWENSDFVSYLKEKFGYDVWNTALRQQIYDIVIWSLESSQDLVENRINSHELYGFDIMVDGELRPWLIEINSSPCMDYSTKVTEKLVKLVLEDLMKIVLDMPQEKSEVKKGMRCGMFYLAHQGDYIEETKSLGKNFLLEGQRIMSFKDL